MLSQGMVDVAKAFEQLARVSGNFFPRGRDWGKGGGGPGEGGKKLFCRAEVAACILLGQSNIPDIGLAIT